MKRLVKKQFKIIVSVVAVVFVLVDHLIKYIVVNNMKLFETIPLIKNVLHLTYVLNDGAAFSFMSGQSWLLCGITSVFMAILIFFFFSKKARNFLLISALGLVISGGIGNLIDRVFRGDVLFKGRVVDYIDFRIVNFAVFNFADCCVTVGAILIVVYILFFERKEENGATQNE